MLMLAVSVMYVNASR